MGGPVDGLEREGKGCHLGVMGQERPGGLLCSVDVPEVGVMLAGGTGLVSLVFPNLGAASGRTRVCGCARLYGACSWAIVSWGGGEKTAEVRGGASAQETALGGSEASGPASVGVPSARAAPVKKRERPRVSQLTLPSPNTTAPRLSNNSFFSSTSVSAFWTATVRLCSHDLFLFSVQSGSWWGEASALGRFLQNQGC